MPRRPGDVVVVNDRMQTGYAYALSAPEGRDFDPEFQPQLTPKEMLALGVFGGKYMTDCRAEFPADWFSNAKLSPARRDASLNYFGVDASQPLVGLASQRLDPSRRSARLVPMVLPLFRRPAHAGGRRAADQALEGDEPPRRANSSPLPTRRSILPTAPAPGAAALGLRQPQALTPLRPPIYGGRAGRKSASIAPKPSVSRRVADAVVSAAIAKPRARDDALASRVRHAPRRRTAIGASRQTIATLAGTMGRAKERAQ